jgi:hypothetical protein
VIELKRIELEHRLAGLQQRALALLAQHDWPRADGR